MAEVSRVFKQGNSLATVIPKKVVEELNVRAGSVLVWMVRDGEAVLRLLEEVSDE